MAAVQKGMKLPLSVDYKRLAVKGNDNRRSPSKNKRKPVIRAGKNYPFGQKIKPGKSKDEGKSTMGSLKGGGITGKNGYSQNTTCKERREYVPRGERTQGDRRSGGWRFIQNNG